MAMFLPSIFDAPSFVMTRSAARSSGILVEDFEFTTTDGQVVNLYSFMGKPVVIDWAASWCSVCKANQESMNELFPYYKNNVHFITISFGESGDTLDDVRSMKNDRQYQWIFGLDTNNKAAEFGTRNGYVWVLNADMSLAKEWAYSIVSASQLQNQLNAILPADQRVQTQLGNQNENPIAAGLFTNPFFLGFLGISVIIIGMIAFLKMRPKTTTPTARLTIEGATKTEGQLKHLQDALDDTTTLKSEDSTTRRKLRPRD